MTEQILSGILGAVLASLGTSFWYTLKFSNHIATILAKLDALRVELQLLHKRVDGIERRLEKKE